MTNNHKSFLWGTSYYPELHARECWTTDLDRMVDLGISGVRILDFAWTAIEPREGEYAFDWLDDFLGLVAERKMWAVLCTPTATPPAWLARQYPEIMIVDRAGRTRPFGNRRDVDVDSPIYQHFAAELARVMGERYSHHPAVIGWQIDNELLGSELMPPECHSRASQFGFRQYLKKVHGSVATLNRRWGMRFWNQEFSDWGEIETPHHERPCTGHYLDYARYFSESQRDFIAIQAAALRKVVEPRQFISHNSTAIFDRGLDHRVFAEPLEVVGWDAYPGAASGAAGTHRAAFTALAADFFRSMRNRSYWIFETDTFEDSTPPAHYAELAARGAAGIIHWLWRSHEAHVEQGSEAICDFAGRVRPEKEQKLRRLYAREEFAHLVSHEFSPQSAALMFSPDCVRASQRPNPYRRQPDTAYLKALGSLTHAARRCGIATDVVMPGDSLDSRRLLLMPSLNVLGEEDAEIIRRFVHEGGTLLATAQTAHFDEWGVYYEEPGQPLADVLGFSQSWPVRNLAEPLEIEWRDGRRFAALPHADRVDQIDGEVLGRFAGGPLDGCPAAFSRTFGKGTVFYLCAPSDLAAFELCRMAGEMAEIRVFDNPHDDVAIFPDLHGKGVWLFNHGSGERETFGTVLAAGDFALVNGQSPETARMN